VQTIEARQGLKIACLEEIAFQRGLIDRAQLELLASQSPPELRSYLEQIASAGRLT
jgi:glucose-1-phosphate thymidylyltransferase